MPALSQSQQRFFGMVHAVQKGDMEAPSKEIADAADDMSEKSVDDFASTKHKGLPKKKSGVVWKRTVEVGKDRKMKKDIATKAAASLLGIKLSSGDVPVPTDKEETDMTRPCARKPPISKAELNPSPKQEKSLIVNEDREMPTPEQPLKGLSAATAISNVAKLAAAKLLQRI